MAYPEARKAQAIVENASAHAAFIVHNALSKEKCSLRHAYGGRRGKKAKWGASMGSSVSEGVFLGLTLNIIEHELKAFGHVERPMQENPMFDEVRIHLDGSAPPKWKASVLYVCDSEEACAETSSHGCHALFVGDEGAAERAAKAASVCLVGRISKLEALNSLLDVFSKYASWESEMSRACYDGLGLQRLIDVSSPFLKNHVVVVDAALKLLAYTKDVPCDDPITVELITHGYHTEENIRKFNLHKRFKPWSEEDGFVINDTYEICKYVTVVKSFKGGGSFSMIVVMMCSVEEPSPYLLDCYSMFVSHARFFAAKDYPAGKPSGNAVDSFLRDLLDGNLTSKATIKKRCGLVGLPYSSHFCLFYTEVHSSDTPFLRLLSDVARAMAPAKTVGYGNAVVVLCFNCAHRGCELHCEGRGCTKGTRSSTYRMNELMELYGLDCGRSSKFTCLVDVAVAYEQAKVAHAFGGEAAGGPGRVQQNWSRITSFDACYLDCLWNAASPDSRQLVLKTYAGAMLDAIAEHDAASHTDNYEFLKTYLECERRASVVAERLHMHRNNVRYRIDRIEQHYGIDTEDPRLRFDLMMGYRLRASSVVQNA